MAQNTVKKRTIEGKRSDKETTKNVDEKRTSGSNKDKNEDELVKPKYGPHVTFPYQRVWSRCVLIVGVMLIVWYNSKAGKEVALAQRRDVLMGRTAEVRCSPEYRADLAKFPGCVPEKCARVVTDKLLTAREIDALLRIAGAGFEHGESDGGASTLDLQTGALSKGLQFVDAFKIHRERDIFQQEDFAAFKVVRTKIQSAIAHHFGVDVKSIYLTYPTFFSKITNKSAKRIHDEYWNPHIDKDSYESFHYTALLYLNDYGEDFKGGRFIFIDQNNVNTTVEPRKGRVLMFTSGKENLHAVEKVTSGTRMAFTVAFTCDKKFATPDPTLKK
ncbi:2-oxoglutarate and iron-dependent oxygenase domain-containing protein 3-like [Trichogramma pretiosum]|uniref:2-oxoglutarate and iron-dependent oxygenase domain-containing protein 3-like n=1 Tax=Trichogramma pretiosum TaxID=7493 RepID=UPI0006C9E3D1|nr:2-oxoglutarate and iron-dependent oxygenase domain-containing protein 3-like [Trichogramma pretiosum]